MSLIQEGKQLKSRQPHRIKPLGVSSSYSLGLRRDELQYAPPAVVQGSVVEKTEATPSFPTEALDHILERGETAVRRESAVVAQKYAKLVELRKAREAKTQAGEEATTLKGTHLPHVGSPNRKLEVGVGKRIQGHTRLYDHNEDEDVEGSLLSAGDIGPDTTQRVWGEEILAEGDLKEGEELDPFAYRSSLMLGGALAVSEPFMTPDEFALRAEQYTDYAATREQFE